MQALLIKPPAKKKKKTPHATHTRRIWRNRRRRRIWLPWRAWRRRGRIRRWRPWGASGGGGGHEARESDRAGGRLAGTGTAGCCCCCWVGRSSGLSGRSEGFIQSGVATPPRASVVSTGRRGPRGQARGGVCGPHHHTQGRRRRLGRWGRAWWWEIKRGDDLGPSAQSGVV
jgi:hypothetical protein